MSKIDFENARHQTREYLQSVGNDGHMFYGPTSDAYWSAPLRILAINMEPYGYEECGHVEIDLAGLLDWMYDRGKTGTKTVRYTLSIVKTLLDAYCNRTVPIASDLSDSFYNCAELESVAQKSVYYNIRSTSNSEKAQDTSSIVASGSDSIAEFIQREMKALEPQIILVSGVAGLAAFNAMWHLAPQLSFQERSWLSNSTLVQSIRHPSRPNYDEYAEVIAEVVRTFGEGPLPNKL